MTKPLLIGIAGGSGSGKTTIARLLRDFCAPVPALLFQLDHYYRDLAHLSPEDRDCVNFDHPEALELELIARHLRSLASGIAIERPTYEFASHTRSSYIVRVEPSEIIFVDGIFTLFDKGIRECLDYGLFVDVGDDIRLIRRLQRDMTERGRSMESVIAQYLSTVKPMHDMFVAGSKAHADLVIDWNSYNERTLRMISNMVLSLRSV